MKQFDPLQLNDDDLIARGQWRTCYRHPYEPGLCVKVLSRQRLSDLKKKTVGNIYRKLVLPKFSRLDTNDKEWKYYNRLCSKGPSVTRYLARIDGFVETNCGRALVAELITDYNGNMSPTFESIVAADLEWPQSFKSLLNRFCVDIIDNDARLYDLNLGNLVLQQVCPGKYEIKVIDVKGAEDSKSLLPLDRWFPTVAAKKMRRRVQRLRTRLGCD